MTNQQIIFNESVKLMNAGKIGNTGLLITVESNGERAVISEPEPIHTYQAWKKLGRQVKKGEKRVADFYIWTPARNRSAAAESEAENEGGDEGENIRMLKTRAFFFTRSQTEPIASN